MENLLDFMSEFKDADTDFTIPSILTEPFLIEKNYKLYAQVLSNEYNNVPEIDAIKVEIKILGVFTQKLVKIFMDPKLRSRWCQFLHDYKNIEQSITTPEDKSVENNKNENQNRSIEYLLYRSFKTPYIEYLIEKKNKFVSDSEFISYWKSIEWNTLGYLSDIWTSYFNNKKSSVNSIKETMFDSGIHIFDKNNETTIILVVKYTNTTKLFNPNYIARIELSNLLKLIELTKQLTN